GVARFWPVGKTPPPPGRVLRKGGKGAAEPHIDSRRPCRARQYLCEHGTHDAAATWYVGSGDARRGHGRQVLAGRSVQIHTVRAAALSQEFLENAQCAEGAQSRPAQT